MMREILKYVNIDLFVGEKAISYARKLLMTEDIPISAWYYKRILNCLHINTQARRVKFNGKKSKKSLSRYFVPLSRN